MEAQKPIEPDKTINKEATDTQTTNTNKKMRKGKWNLLMLGIFSIVVAVATTGVSLLIYHNSGDIYLDRSRPGYLPDEEEIGSEGENELEYELDKSGKMSMEVLEEYLDNLDLEIKAIDSFEKPFGQDVLSNDRLGIPAE